MRQIPDQALTTRARWVVLISAFLGLVFDGIELGLMPIASLSVSQSLLGETYTKQLGGEWFAWFTAALMLGAAIGGIVLGNLGDRIGRTRAMGISILFYSLFAMLGAWVQTQEQMLALRFLVGLGVGGLWPNAMALVSECWPTASRAWVAGLLSAGLNAGILLLSQITRLYPVEPNAWRWLFGLAGLPTLLGIFALLAVPESPLWLAHRSRQDQDRAMAKSDSSKRFALSALFETSMWKSTCLAMLLAAIPLVAAWSASKWMIPWADSIASSTDPGYKSATQGWWAFGATLGSFLGAQAAVRLGARWSYFSISVGAICTTLWMFLGTEPLQASFLPTVFLQGLVTTLFFGWLAVYLPSFFPVELRASGSGLAYNVGRFATALGVFLAGSLLASFGNSYPRIGAACGVLYGVGIFASFAIGTGVLTSLVRESQDSKS
ncbi:MAG: hypothetical protein RL069_191 [Planctomycetota bacterium]